MFLRAARPRRCSARAAARWFCYFSAIGCASRSDLIENQQRGGVRSRFSLTLGEPLTETDVAVRSLLALPAEDGTMLNIAFVVASALGLAALIAWGVRTLPAERWQMLAAVPIAKVG